MKINVYLKPEDPYSLDFIEESVEIDTYSDFVKLRERKDVYKGVHKDYNYYSRMSSYRIKNLDFFKSKYKMPEITGSSEKQIKFANDLRDACIASEAVWEGVDKMLDEQEYHPDRFANALERLRRKHPDMTVEEYIDRWFKFMNPFLRKVMTTSDASSLISLMK